MNIAELTTSMPSWLLFVVIFLLGILAAEAGAAVTRRREGKLPEDKKPTPIGSLMGAMLGLLAFMLGFTFSITSSRYGERKHLVVDQANAMGTCYLRTDLLPEKQKIETRRLFAQYIDLLVTASKEVDSVVPKIEAIQMQIWEQASSLKNEAMDSPLRSLYIASVNQVIDIFAERKTVVLTFRIPAAIWAVLFLLYLLNLFLVGLESGANKNRKSLNIPIMTASFALVVMLIASMDASTREGRFTVNRQPLLDLQKMIREENAKLLIR